LELTNYTTRQIAEITGKSVETVRKWIRAGHLKGHKPPGCRDHVVKKEDFEKFWYGSVQPKAVN
jgi:excisionase family DNA binding protein